MMEADRLSVPPPLDLPGEWWGWPGSRRRDLTARQLIERDLLSPELAAWLWLLIERGASVIVCAGPGGAGKSTLAAALTAFLPAGRLPYLVRGAYDPLDLPAAQLPDETTLLINELSRHLPVYVWGEAARRALAAGMTGAQLLATAHARLPEELLRLLAEPPLSSSPEQLQIWDLAIFIEAGWSDEGVYRRVASIVSLSLTGDGGARWRRLAVGQGRGAPALDAGALQVLAVAFGVPKESIASEIERRIVALSTAE